MTGDWDALGRGPLQKRLIASKRGCPDKLDTAKEGERRWIAPFGGSVLAARHGRRVYVFRDFGEGNWRRAERVVWLGPKEAGRRLWETRTHIYHSG